MTGLILLQCLFMTGGAIANTYYVHFDGSGGGPPFFPTIQAAIDYQNLVNGDVIKLIGTPFTGPGNRDVDFGGKLITVQSLHGSPTTCVIDVQGTEDDNHRGFIFHTGETSQALVQGVTIQNGLISCEDGAGILCDGASPTINNCRIISNHAGWYCSGNGGGIGCVNSSAPVITGCVISDCSAGRRHPGNGGGLYSDDSSSPTLQNCVISSNVAGSSEGGGSAGGGIDCSTAHILTCTIYSNSADVGGGIACGAAFITGCTIEGNGARTYGGLYGGSTTIVGSVISGNSGGDGVGGLGGGPFSITSCTITGNEGTMSVGGIQGSATLTQTILWGNCGLDGPDGGNGLTFICCDVNPAQVGDCIFIGPQVNEDPLFCAPADCANAPTTAGDYSLQAGSPCLPPGPCGSLIGALPQGCSGPVPTEKTTWGRLKWLFR